MRTAALMLLAAGCAERYVATSPQDGGATAPPTPGDLGRIEDFAFVDLQSPPDMLPPIDLSAAPGCATTISASGNRTCAALADGRLYCWGVTLDFEGEYPNLRPSPTEDLLTGDVVDVLGSDDWTCVRRADASVWCRGGYVRYDPGNVLEMSGSPTPLHVVDNAAQLCGTLFSCAIDSNGALAGWSPPYSNTDLDSHNPGSPVRHDLEVFAMAGGVPVVGASIAYSQGCAIRPDHTLWCWSISNDRSVSQPWSQFAADVAEVGVADDFGCLRKIDRSIWCWGDDFFGALGDGGGGTDSKVPVEVTALSVPSRALFVGAVTVCALGEDERLRCWGTLPGMPVNSIAKPTVVFDGSGAPFAHVSRVSLGWRHACSITTDANIWCWGMNDSGQLGIGGQAPPNGAPTIGPPVLTPTLVALPCAN